jgi:hypothetical protein
MYFETVKLSAQMVTVSSSIRSAADARRTDATYRRFGETWLSRRAALLAPCGVLSRLATDWAHYRSSPSLPRRHRTLQRSVHKPSFHYASRRAFRPERRRRDRQPGDATSPTSSARVSWSSSRTLPENHDVRRYAEEKAELLDRLGHASSRPKKALASRRHGSAGSRSRAPLRPTSP